MDTKNLEQKIDLLKDSVDKLILIELFKLKVTRDEARSVLGSLDNNTFATINKIFNK
jgi:hypothetical protein